MQTANLGTLFFVLLLWKCSVSAQPDPCLGGNHAQLSDLGARNDRCRPSTTDINSNPCDLYLRTGWYKAENATIRNQAPSIGTCSVVYPIWMIDQFGSIKNNEVVNRTVCIQEGAQQCNRTLQIKIKNCGSFYLYYLLKLSQCTSVYCFDSSLPCVQPTTTLSSSSKAASTTNAAGTNPTENNHHDDDGDKTNNTGLIVGLAVGCTGCVLVAILIATLVIKHLHKPLNGQVKDSSSEAVSPPPPYSTYIEPTYK